ncbi:MAG TPA: hypothetical protein VF577_04030 [Allosphingosinicella sp.]|jgi:hypothetical protein
MQRAQWNRPSCILMLALLALLLGALVWLISGDPLRTPSPTSVPKETSTYDTDVPSSKPGDGR